MRLAGFVKAAYQLHCSVAFAKQYNRILRRSNCVVGSTLVACVNFANSQPNQFSSPSYTILGLISIKYYKSSYTQLHSHLISSLFLVVHHLPYLICVWFPVISLAKYQLPAVRRYWFTTLTCSDLSCGCAIIVCLVVYSHASTIIFLIPHCSRPFSCCY